MTSTPWIRRVGLALAAALLLVALGPAPMAWAADGDIEGSWQGLLKILLVIVLALVFCVGIGATTLLIRIVLPGVAAAADASLARLSTKRLLLGGILPLIGVALLGRGVELAGSSVLSGILALGVALPLALALVAGAVAALPHVGTQVMRADSDASPLARASMGGLVVGLSMTSWALPPLGVLVSVLLAGWLVGIGLGGVLRRPSSEAPPAAAPAAE